MIYETPSKSKAANLSLFTFFWGKSCSKTGTHCSRGKNKGKKKKSDGFVNFRLQKKHHCPRSTRKWQGNQTVDMLPSKQNKTKQKSSPNTQKYIVSCRVKIILYAFHKGIENEWCFPKPNWIIMKTPYKTYTSQTHVKPFTLWTSNNISYRHLAVKASEQDSILHHFRVQQMVPTDQTPFVTAKCFMFLHFLFFFKPGTIKKPKC